MADDDERNHLMVLMHGLHGSVASMHPLQRAIDAEHGDIIETVIAACNTGALGKISSFVTTADGIVAGGTRLADTIEQYLLERPRVTRLSVLGVSLGGLYVRYALGKLLARGRFVFRAPEPLTSDGPSDEGLRCIELVNFITVVSPATGVRRHLPRFIKGAIKHLRVIGQTGSDLLLSSAGWNMPVPHTTPAGAVYLDAQEAFFEPAAGAEAVEAWLRAAERWGRPAAADRPVGGGAESAGKATAGTVDPSAAAPPAKAVAGAAAEEGVSGETGAAAAAEAGASGHVDAEGSAVAAASEEVEAAVEELNEDVVLGLCPASAPVPPLLLRLAAVGSPFWRALRLFQSRVVLAVTELDDKVPYAAAALSGPHHLFLHHLSEAVSSEAASAGATSTEAASAGATSSEAASAGATSSEAASAGATSSEAASAGATSSEAASAGAASTEAASAGATSTAPDAARKTSSEAASFGAETSAAVSSGAESPKAASPSDGSDRPVVPVESGGLAPPPSAQPWPGKESTSLLAVESLERGLPVLVDVPKAAFSVAHASVRRFLHGKAGGSGSEHPAIREAALRVQAELAEADVAAKAEAAAHLGCTPAQLRDEWRHVTGVFLQGPVGAMPGDSSGAGADGVAEEFMRWLAVLEHPVSPESAMAASLRAVGSWVTVNLTFTEWGASMMNHMRAAGNSWLPGDRSSDDVLAYIAQKCVLSGVSFD